MSSWVAERRPTCWTARRGKVRTERAVLDPSAAGRIAGAGARREAPAEALRRRRRRGVHQAPQNSRSWRRVDEHAGGAARRCRCVRPPPGRGPSADLARPVTVEMGERQQVVLALRLRSTRRPPRSTATSAAWPCPRGRRSAMSPRGSAAPCRRTSRRERRSPASAASKRAAAAPVQHLPPLRRGAAGSAAGARPPARRRARRAARASRTRAGRGVRRYGSSPIGGNGGLPEQLDGAACPARRARSSSTYWAKRDRFATTRICSSLVVGARTRAPRVLRVQEVDLARGRRPGAAGAAR